MGRERVSCVVFFAAVGCTSGVPAAASRVVDTDAARLSGTPVCFAPADPSWSLTAKDEHQRAVRQCEAAAAKRSVRVQPFANGGCLVATLEWKSRSTGKHVDDCTRSFAGATCEGHMIMAKSLRIALAEPGKRAVAESNASIASNSTSFSEQSYFALCSAAFHDYPLPLTRTEFEVDTE